MQERGRAFALGHVDIHKVGHFCGKFYVSREQQDGNMWLARPHSSCDFPAMHSGHGVVEDDNVDFVAVEDRQTRKPIERREHGVPRTLENELAHLKTYDFIIDAKDDMTVVYQKGPPELILMVLKI